MFQRSLSLGRLLGRDNPYDLAHLLFDRELTFKSAPTVQLMHTGSAVRGLAVAQGQV